MAKDFSFSVPLSSCLFWPITPWRGAQRHSVPPGLWGRYGLAAHTATILPNGTVLVAGGSSSNSGSDILATAELYDPATGTFSSTGSMGTTRIYHTATLLPNGKVLVAGGHGAVGGSDIYRATAELYDPATGTFSPTGSMGTARYHHTATLLPNGKVLVASGYDGVSGVFRATAELYDPATGTFSSTGSMGTARVVHKATLLPNGKVLVAGGNSAGVYLATAELYDPATGTFSSTGSMGTARYSQTATLLPNGKVLMAGGQYGGGYVATAELYDPATGTFSSTGSMGTARYVHTAALLPNGKVLVAGGYGGVYLATAELYDPGTGTFSPTGSMGTARYSHTATLLPTNGKVLVAGGYNAYGAVYLATAELYDPATDTDGDSILDNEDNCPTVPNSDQNNLDGDLMGDACDPDIDGDGVANGSDLCAGTPLSSVVNPTNGCSVAQLCPCNGPRGTTLPWQNHGKYVSCVAHATGNFVAGGLITESEKEAIVSAAAQSMCGGKK